LQKKTQRANESFSKKKNPTWSTRKKKFAKLNKSFLQKKMDKSDFQTIRWFHHHQKKSTLVVAPRFLAKWPDKNDLGNAEQAQLSYNSFCGIQRLHLSRHQHQTFPHEPRLQAALPNHILGHTNDGRQVYLSSIGALDCAALHERPGLHAELVHNHVLLMEHLLYLGQQHGRHIATHIMICDMRGFSLGHVAPGPLALLGEISRLDDQHYPFVTEQVFLINAPFLLTLVWNIIYPLLGATLKNKIHFVSHASIESNESTLCTLLDPASLQLVRERLE